MNRKITSDQLKNASGFSFLNRDRKYVRDMTNLWKSAAKREVEAVCKVEAFLDWYHSDGVPCPFNKEEITELADELMDIAELRCGEVLEHVREDYLFISKITAISFFGGFTFSELIKLLDYTAKQLN